MRKDSGYLNRKISAKMAMLKILDNEMTALTGRLLSEEEQLRVLSIGEDIDRLENELLNLEGSN